MDERKTRKKLAATTEALIRALVVLLANPNDRGAWLNATSLQKREAVLSEKLDRYRSSV